MTHIAFSVVHSANNRSLGMNDQEYRGIWRAMHSYESWHDSDDAVVFRCIFEANSVLLSEMKSATNNFAASWLM